MAFCKAGGRAAAFAVLALLVVVGVLVGLPSMATAAPLTFANITVGAKHACGITAGGQAYCWGRNDEGQLGNGGNIDSAVPVAVSGGLTFTSISAGNYFTCGVTDADAGYCWGAGTSGQIGNGASASVNSPTLVAGSHAWASIESGVSHSCGVTTGGAAYCWGWNNNGQVGIGNTFNADTPALVSGGYTWASISAGGFDSCGIRDNGAAYCWGWNIYGELGDNSTNQSTTPVSVNGGLTFSSISVGRSHTCALTTGGVAYCWGGWNNGSLGDNSGSDQHQPVAVSGGFTWTSISTGALSTCGIRSNGASYCWGTNDNGNLGDGTTTNRATPTLIVGGNAFTSISTGGRNDGSADGRQACALNAAGVAYCWGDNSEGQLGDTTTTERHVPTITFIEVSNSTVAAVVDPSLTFTVAGMSSCQGLNASAGVSATATALGLGRLGVNGSMGIQSLHVATNAGQGWTVYVRSTGALASPNGHSIASVSGTNANPGSFPAAGSEAFGYTTTDSTLNGAPADRFTNGGPNWAAITTTNAEVFTGNAPHSGVLRCVGYQAQTGPTTPAGAYATNVVYTAVATF